MMLSYNQSWADATTVATILHITDKSLVTKHCFDSEVQIFSRILAERWSLKKLSLVALVENCRTPSSAYSVHARMHVICIVFSTVRVYTTTVIYSKYITVIQCTYV